MKKKVIPLLCLLLMSCAHKPSQSPEDPYENVNRKIYKFNKAVDATVFRPVAQIYKSSLPPLVRTGIRNFFNNIQMVPTVANDLLQGQPLQAYKDTWRFILNSTLGLAGTIDVAEKCSLPYKPNDLGITLAKWGDNHSPYFVMPIFGPSTFRDAVGLSFDYSLLSVYPHIQNEKVLYGLLALNMVEIRADLLDAEPLLDEAIDEYSMVRDAYLQNRDYKITGKSDSADVADESLYIEADEAEATDGSDDGALYVDEEEETALNHHHSLFQNQITKVS